LLPFPRKHSGLANALPDELIPLVGGLQIYGFG
jgi:hypothetical protein